MSDEKLTDEVLTELRTKALEARELAPQAGPGAQDAHRSPLHAFHAAASPEAVLALIEEVRQGREAERKRTSNYDWLEKARREGKAVSLGRSGWALPPQLKGEPEK